MIIDRIEHADFYKSLNPRIKRGLELLEMTDFSDMEPGRYKVDDVISYLVQDFDTIPMDNAYWEYHCHTADIQYVLSGCEAFGYTDVSRLDKENVTTPYDSEDDLGRCFGEGDFVLLKPGMFAIQLPHDAHLPDHHLTQPSRVRKIVVKIAWDEI